MIERKRKIWWLIAGLLLVGGIALFGRFTRAKTTALNIATATVAIADIEDTVLATGKLEPKELVSVGAQVSGQLKSLNVKLGQTVKAGQLIAEIDAQPQQNAVQNAELAIANVRAQRAARVATQRQAQLLFDRQSKMLESGGVSRADYDAAQAALDSANADIAAYDAQIKQATTQLDAARVNLGYTKIVAPMDGVVVAIVTKQGQTLNANQSAPTIIMLAKLDVMTVKAQVSEADVVKVKPGQPVYFTTLGTPDRRYYATIRQIEPAPESIANSTQTATSGSTTSASAIYYNALFDVPNTDNSLYTSMTTQVYVVISSVKNALTIPLSALGDRESDGRYTVQVLGADNKTTSRKVRIGINTKAMVQILEGLRASEKVVVGEAQRETSSADNGPPGLMGL